MKVVIRWYYCTRDGQSPEPEMSGVFGPFADEGAADAWIRTAPARSGWGDYRYAVEPLETP